MGRFDMEKDQSQACSPEDKPLHFGDLMTSPLTPPSGHP